MSASVDHISQHILKQFAARKAPSQPLFVALQGPQGSGKSYLTGLTHKLLSSPPHSLRVATVSIDDLYLTHAGLVDIASKNSDNPLWRGRGQPGTHDINLAIQVLTALRDTSDVDVEIPVFDKSLFNGEGDRLPMHGNSVHTPLDVAIVEGWCMGFHPIPSAALHERWSTVWEKEKLALGLTDAMLGSKQCLEAINKALHSYLELWSFFDTFIQATTIHSDCSSPYSVIYQWRLEQEHYMKARNGGVGMTDDAVKLFVDRYIPGYVFFGDGVTDGYIDGDGTHHAPPWSGQGIRILIDEHREVVGVGEL
ncbi:hypothetical protein CPB85DRAFT_1223056 [Mucidula mucida]|nr:hypothetical protein CPB85DRAFT_1223056 [Mucidula mucida]